jgi:anti-sigma B factor antagonist
VQIELRQASERVTVLAPMGRLDMSTAAIFRDQVKDLVESGTTRLVVDFDGVIYLDSWGLGAVIGAIKATRQAGGDLSIARPSRQVMLVLDLTSLNNVLTPHDSLEEAIASLLA